MLVRYVVAVEDLLAFSRFFYNSWPLRKWLQVILILLLSVVVFAVSLVIPSDALTLPMRLTAATIVSLVASMLFIYLARPFTDQMIRLTFKAGAKTNGILGQHESEVDESGLVERTELRMRRASEGSADSCEDSEP